jgi:hypothetical protein
VKRPPVPRPRIYDLYWYFASERQQMFARRVAGEPGPWTEDPILREFKFCNVFRAADRVSQYMIRDVCYHDEPCTPEDRLFQILAFRTFSKTVTWQAVRDVLGRYPVLDNLADGSFTSALDQTRQRNGGLAGPGALRGIRKCFENLGDYTPAEIVLWMTERQHDEFVRLGLPFAGLWGRPLHAIDCQGLFCETDKYCREAAPELASARKRIKARFTPTHEPIRLFFPPKWRINDKLPSNPFRAGQVQENAGQRPTISPSVAAAPSQRAGSGWCPRRSG